MPSSSKSSQPQVPRPPNSRRKPNPTSKLPKSRATPSYFVLDTIFPSHIVNDRSLFTTYTPSNRIYRTAFGTDITIEGTGNVEVCVQAGGKSIIFTVHDCWHIPSSTHHFLSCLTVTSPTPNGRHQIMLAGRTPRLLFPHKDRLVTPNLPKYVPVAREQGYFVIKFKVPMKTPLPPEPALANTKSSSLKFPSFSLYTSESSCQPFAGLTLACPSSLDKIEDEIILLKDKGTFFTEPDEDHHDVFIGITDTFSPESPPPSFSSSPSLPSLPQHSSSSFSESWFPPTLISPRQFSSDNTTVVHVRENSTCYTSADSVSAPHGGAVRADAPVSMDIPIMDRIGDVGIVVGSPGSVYSAVSTSAYEHTLPPPAPLVITYQPFSGAAPTQFSASTAKSLSVIRRYLPSSPIPPLLPLPPHYPPPPTVAFLSMMTPPSLIPRCPVSLSYMPHLSPTKHDGTVAPMSNFIYQPIQQPVATTVTIGGYQREH